MSGRRKERPKTAKPTGDVILITRQLRLDLIDIIALDLGISDNAFRIFSVISTHFGNRSGLTWLSQEYIAAATGKSVQTVQRAIRELEAAGYLIVQRRMVGTRTQNGKVYPVYGSNGSANEYLPACDKVAITALDRPKNLPDRVISAWQVRIDRLLGKHTTDDVLQEGKHITDGVLPDCESTPNERLKHITSGVPTLSYPTGKNSSLARGPSSTDVLGPAGERIKRAIGDPAYRSWFGSVAIVSVIDGVATMSAPTPFIRARLIQDFDIVMLRAWQSVDPTVQRVTVVLAEASK